MLILMYRVTQLYLAGVVHLKRSLKGSVSREERLTYTDFVTQGEDRWTWHKCGKKQRIHIGVSNRVIVAKLLSEYRKTDGEIALSLID